MENEQNPNSQMNEAMDSLEYQQQVYQQQIYQQQVYQQQMQMQQMYDQQVYAQQIPQEQFQQGVGMQQPYTAANPVLPVEQNKKEQPYTPAQLAKAKTLCIISLVCYVLPLIGELIAQLINSSPLGEITDISSYYGGSKPFYSQVSNFVLLFTSFGTVAAYVLMIVARATYPKYKFAKVLMWVYIGIFAVVAISVIVIMIVIYITCTSCLGSTDWNSFWNGLKGCG